MATVYYGINRGAHAENVAAGTATQGTNVEIRVDEGVVLTRQELFEAIDNLRQFILTQPYPFA